MLTKVRQPGSSQGSKGARFAIVASRYNERFVDAMVAAAERILRDANAATVDVVRVPGAYEIPLLAATLARSKRPRYSAVICLGVVIRGETAHADLIGTAVTNALTQIQIEQELPVIHEVLLLNNVEQAEARCLGKKHNRGAEAAVTALEMAEVMSRIRGRR